MQELTASQCTTTVPPSGTPISPELLARHEGLVRWVVRRQYLGNLSIADALHEGRIGLWRALVHYDPGRGTAFSSYAVPAIRHAVWEAVAADRKLAHPVSRLSAPVAPMDPDEWTYRGQLRATLRALVEELPPRLRWVMVAHYGLADSEPESFTALGRALRVSRQRAQQLHVEALLWLAHPAHSLTLRRLLGLDTRAAYQRTLVQGYQIARSRRCSRRVRR